MRPASRFSVGSVKNRRVYLSLLQVTKNFISALLARLTTSSTAQRRQRLLIKALMSFKTAILVKT
jgi:hypothetical protein